MGYIKDIFPNSYDSHQMSPSYCLTFLRFSNRDTKNYTGSSLDVRAPLVVYNDALSVVVSNHKTSISPTATFVLKGGDLNYATAIATGDFVIVNLLSWETDAQRIHDKALTYQPINEINDGFKGVFKVQSVVKGLTVDPSSGVKTVVYTITAAGFTEFNNSIYYNPAIVEAFKTTGTLLYQSEIGQAFANLIKGRSDIDYLMGILFKVLIGQPVKSTIKDVQDFGNAQFQLPSTLGLLLGKPQAFLAADLFDYIIGTWGDSLSSKVDGNEGFIEGFNPNFKPVETDPNKPNNYWKTGNPILGNKQVDIGDWNSNTAWSLLGGYLNEAMNEMYTTYRITPSGRIQPTVVVRQKPFTTEHFQFSDKGEKTPLTRFLQLPRWRISSDLLLSLQTSKNESFRFNFVQLFTRSLPDVAAIDQAAQISLQNFVADEKDIKRHGLKPYIKTSNFDFPGTGHDSKRLRAKEWSEMLADWVLELNMKESGMASFVGIQDAISIGDNIEIDGIIYHIEGISHSMMLTASGHKKWKTDLTLSYGIDARSSKNGPVYANMDFTDAYTNNKDDWAHEKLMPGISDTQNISGRVDGEEVVNTKEQSFTPDNLIKPRSKAPTPPKPKK